MKRLMNWMILGGMIAAVAACNYSRPTGGSVTGGALMSPSGLSGTAADQNNEGVDHFAQGHYDVAKGHFEKALAAKPNFAEAHYNMALVHDAMGDHGAATDSFKKAAELAPDNPKITGSEILKKHTGM